MGMRHCKKFVLVDETKGALKYTEVALDGTLVKNFNDPTVVVGAIYLRKAALGNKKPPTIIVTVEDAPEKEEK